MKLYKPGDPIPPLKGPKKKESTSPAIRMGTKHLGKPGVYKDPNNGYVAQNRKRFVVQNPDLPKNRVSVSVVRTEEGRVMIQTEVWATHGTGNKSVIGTVDPGQCVNAADLLYKVQTTTGACAEHLCEAFGDDLDPDYCAKISTDLLKEAVLKAKDTLRQGGVLGTL